MNRRELLKSAAGLAGVAALSRTGWAAGAGSGEVPVTVLEARLALDPRRPQFHLLPMRNWMNDPNGPIYWNGHYHMFFQYNPHAAVWGDMHWAHAMSEDMVHWEHLPVALAPTPGGPDAAGCFSGTAVVDNGVVTVLYTGVVKASPDDATIRDGVNTLRESQCLAMSTDPELKVWKKLPQPVIAAPPAGMHVTGFRDPSPWRKGEWWYMTVGSGVAHEGGDVLLYRSRDLRHWEYLHEVAVGSGSGKQAVNPVDDGDMWECPDLFPLDGKHVLIFSSQGKVHWQSGLLDEAAMRFHPEHEGIVDHGTYYAAKTQRDAHGRRILWGWVTETRSVAEYKAAGWAGLMSLPRVLSLRSDGTLGMEVASEVKGLRRSKQALTPGKDAQRQLPYLRIEKATGELLATVSRGQNPWTLNIRGILPQGPIVEPIATIAYDPAKPRQLQINGASMEVPGVQGEPLEIHAYVDGSVAEMMVHRAVSYTRRFYYPGSEAPDVDVEFDGPAEALTSLSVWQITPISSDRLTT